MKNRWMTLLLTLPLLYPSLQTGTPQAQSTKEDVTAQKDKQTLQAHIPANYRVVEKIEGDLNKDSIKDLALVVKATDPKAIIEHEYRGRLDRNRRGMVVLLNEGGKYRAILSNLNCFSSENEDGGVYYPPDLMLEIKDNLLRVHYLHGRHGSWRYLFRLEGNDFRLIGYDTARHRGPYIIDQISINFLTGKKLVRNNMNTNSNTEPKFKDEWSTIESPPLYLSQIGDFNRLDFEPMDSQ